jgi:hypothetical protein
MPTEGSENNPYWLRPKGFDGPFIVEPPKDPRPLRKPSPSGVSDTSQLDVLVRAARQNPDAGSLTPGNIVQIEINIHDAHDVDNYGPVCEELRDVCEQILDRPADAEDPLRLASGQTAHAPEAKPETRRRAPDIHDASDELARTFSDVRRNTKDAGTASAEPARAEPSTWGLEGLQRAAKLADGFNVRRREIAAAVAADLQDSLNASPPEGGREFRVTSVEVDRLSPSFSEGQYGLPAAYLRANISFKVQRIITHNGAWFMTEEDKAVTVVLGTLTAAGVFTSVDDFRDDGVSPTTLSPLDFIGPNEVGLLAEVVASDFAPVALRSAKWSVEYADDLARAAARAARVPYHPPMSAIFMSGGGLPFSERGLEIFLQQLEQRRLLRSFVQSSEQIFRAEVASLRGNNISRAALGRVGAERAAIKIEELARQMGLNVSKKVSPNRILVPEVVAVPRDHGGAVSRISDLVVLLPDRNLAIELTIEDVGKLGIRTSQRKADQIADFILSQKPLVVITDK